MATARRFRRPVFLWAVVALLTELAVGGKLWGPVPALVSALPLVPLLLFLITLVAAIQKMDELQKRICLESASIAFMLTLALAFVLAGLERAGIYRTTLDDIGSPMMFLWACAYVYSSWRYR
jgi:hypothetical protein